MNPTKNHDGYSDAGAGGITLVANKNTGKLINANHFMFGHILHKNQLSIGNMAPTRNPQSVDEYCDDRLNDPS